MRGYILVLMAATLWGAIGIFYKHIIGVNGITVLAAVLARGVVACTFLVSVLAVWRRDLLRIERHHVPYFVISGTITVGLVFSLYAYTISTIGVSIAAVLQYTAPAFVTVIASLVFHESLDRRRVLALVCTLLGCFLVSRIYDPVGFQLNPKGILAGLGTGLTFGLFSIFNKQAVQWYSPWTVTTYNLCFGSLFLLVLQQPSAVAAVLSSPQTWPFILALAIGPTIGAHGLYTSGLKLVPASNASIVATWEPVSATIMAYALLGERLDVLQLLGAACIIVGVILLSCRAS